MANVLAISAGTGHLLALVDGLQAPPPLLFRGLGDAGIGLVVPSFPKANYHLEHNATFDPETWMTIESRPGNGAALWITEPDISAPRRFFRIRQD